MGRKKKESVEIDEEKVSIESPRDLKYISSGSTNLNLALTNNLEQGYPVGKIVNLVGDKALGKSLLCLEVMMYAHYIISKKYDIKMIYNDTESALNVDGAVLLGVPIEAIDFRQSPTIEHWYADLSKEIESSEKYDLVIYILDSLDAISTEEELEQDFNAKSYNMTKQKKLSELFRKLTQKINKKNVLLIVVSQIRDAIGVTFGETKRRAGGKALDFYAYQIIWLYNKGLIKDGNIATGVEIKAKVKKNRCWKPFREVNFNILFEYGIDDLGSMVDFLKDNKVCTNSHNSKLLWEDQSFTREGFIQFISNNNKEQEIKNLVKETWDKIEEAAKIIRKPKYEFKEIADNFLNSTDNINTESTMFTGKT